MELVMQTIWGRITETLVESKLTSMSYEEVYQKTKKSIPNLWVFDTMVETALLPLADKIESMQNHEIAELLNKALDGKIDTDYITPEDREAGLELFDDLIKVYYILKS